MLFRDCSSLPLWPFAILVPFFTYSVLLLSSCASSRICMKSTRSYKILRLRVYHCIDIQVTLQLYMICYFSMLVFVIQTSWLVSVFNWFSRYLYRIVGFFQAYRITQEVCNLPVIARKTSRSQHAINLH